MSRRIDIEALCAEKGLRITEQRRVIARVLSESEDHPDVEALHARAAAIDSGISIATVYRTVRLFEEAGILERHDFGDGRARYEAAAESHTTILSTLRPATSLSSSTRRWRSCSAASPPGSASAWSITAWSSTASPSAAIISGRTRGHVEPQ